MAQSRLWRILERAGVPRPLVTMTIGPATFDDRAISQLSMHHGTDGPDEGVHPATMTAALPAVAPLLRNGQEIKVTLNDAAAKALDRIAYMNINEFTAYPGLKSRFGGKVAKTDVDDEGPRQNITVSAASWSAQWPHFQDVYTIPASTGIFQAVKTITHPKFYRDISVTKDGLSTFIDATAVQMEGRYPDLIDKLTTDIGFAVLERRDGSCVLADRSARRQRADTWLTAFWAIPRAMTDAPTSWSMPSEGVTTNLGVRYKDLIQNEKTYLATTGANPNVVTEMKDWTHIAFGGDNYKFIEVLEWRSALDTVSLNLKIDLLHVLELATGDRPVQTAVFILRILLQIEAGDPVKLATDWPTHVAGFYFATGITEHITADEWSITLALTPYRHITGAATPTVNPRLWNEATMAWNSTNGKTWDDYH